ncbi:B3 domain-containing transcription factor ABI3-like isoform X2 [Apium graveolens]|uniref:B3 domain-containing transcription factor ABI3-like isoform X2 n=1 Tax=Apium graveolens TaxID=4045 RepID=UPI003D7B6285
MKGEHRDDVHEKNRNQIYNYEMMGTFGKTEIWRGSEQEEDLIADSSIFYNVFPTLGDFPCMSSTSSSSSTPALTKLVSPNSSTSSASSAVMKSDVSQEQQGLKRVKYEVDGEGSALSCTDGSGGIEYVDCMDVMEDFGYMDLIEDGNDMWDPSSIFQDDVNQVENQGGLKREPENRENDSFCMIGRGKEVVEDRMGVDELGVMFFEWLKTNKEHISAEDMKKIKFKKATIECAYKRMGCTKEGKKQLFKLILEWVEQFQLSKKRREKAAAVEAASSHQVSCQYQEPSPNPNPNPKPEFINFIPTQDPNACMWIPKTQTGIDPEMVMPPVSAPPAVAYHQYPFVGGANVAPMNCQPYAPQMPQNENQMLESAQSWPRSQFVLPPQQYNSFTDQNANFVPIAPQPVAPVYGEQYPSQVYNGTNKSESVVRLPPSATKEARKKRMARKKRGSFHRQHPHQNQIQKGDSPQQSNDEGKPGAEKCTNNIVGQSSPVSWLYWPPIGTSKFPQPPMKAQSPQLEGHLGYSTLPLVQAQSNRPLAQSDRGGKQQKKQGSQGEKNLKFLLQKVLKQSDVGNLGRIVLPKKEAETQLPQLEGRDGIPIVVEDIATSKVWNLRYRFWPNNKSRMYVLENTGEFVKENGLQEGDFIVLYSDIRYNKYLIRGVKVREPAKGKFEVKTTRKNQYTYGAGIDVPLHAPSKLNDQLSDRIITRRQNVPISMFN